MVTTTSTSTDATVTVGVATEPTPRAVARAVVGTVGAARVPAVELSSRLDTVKEALLVWSSRRRVDATTTEQPASPPHMVVVSARNLVGRLARGQRHRDGARLHHLNNDGIGGGGGGGGGGDAADERGHLKGREVDGRHIDGDGRCGGEALRRMRRWWRGRW